MSWFFLLFFFLAFLSLCNGFEKYRKNATVLPWLGRCNFRNNKLFYVQMIYLREIAAHAQSNSCARNPRDCCDGHRLDMVYIIWFGIKATWRTLGGVFIASAIHFYSTVSITAKSENSNRAIARTEKRREKLWWEILAFGNKKLRLNCIMSASFVRGRSSQNIKRFKQTNKRGNTK